MENDNLQHALTAAADRIRAQFPELTGEDVREAYTAYRKHFAEGNAHPPMSERHAMDELLLALWDVIVDRETAGADSADDLEKYYAEAFASLLAPPSSIEQPPVAIALPIEEVLDQPAPVLEEAADTLDDVAEEDPQEQIYTIRVSLDGSDPEIWRRVLVPAGVGQAELHYILQAAMGWRGSEQFQFLPPQDRELPTSGEARLQDLLPEVGADCGYEFDRGTTWYHHLLLEAVGPPEGRRRYPVCTAGQRACPPEDVGGLKEYEEMLTKMQDPTQEEYREMGSWLTQDFNPASFNIEQANLRLSRHGQVSFKAVV